MPAPLSSAPSGRSVVGAVAAAAVAVCSVLAGFLPAVHTRVADTNVQFDSYAYVTGQQVWDGFADPPAQPWALAFLTGVALAVLLSSVALAWSRWQGRPVRRWHLLVPALAFAWASDWTWVALLQPTADDRVTLSLGSGGILLLVAVVASLVSCVETSRVMESRDVGDHAWFGESAAIGGLGLAAALWVPVYAEQDTEFYLGGKMVSHLSGETLTVDGSALAIGLVALPAVALVALGCWELLAGTHFSRALRGRTPTGLVTVILAWALLVAYTTIPTALLKGLTSDDLDVTAGGWLGLTSKLLIAVATVVWIRGSSRTSTEKMSGSAGARD